MRLSRQPKSYAKAVERVSDELGVRIDVPDNFAFSNGGGRASETTEYTESYEREYIFVDIDTGNGSMQRKWVPFWLNHHMGCVSLDHFKDALRAKVKEVRV